MIWFLVVAFVAGTCGYVVGDYFGFRRGKEDSYQLWQKRLGRAWTGPDPRLGD